MSVYPWSSRVYLAARQFLQSHEGVRTIKKMVGVVLAAGSCTGEPANARQEFPLRVARLGLSDVMPELSQRALRRQIVLAPRSNSEFDRKANQQRSLCQNCNDRPLPTLSHSSTYCVRGETELVGSITDSASSTLPLAKPAGSSTPSSTNRSLPLADNTWFIVGAVILLAVTLTPGLVVLWFFGLAGFVVGITSLFLDLSWEWQLITFAMSGIALALLCLRLDRPSGDRYGVTDQPFRSRVQCAFVGRVLRLQKPIVDGIGVVTIGGTVWRVAGRDCAAGKRVKVVHAEGTLLIVDPLEN